MKIRNQRGFTLLEMAIVLVIIGTLVGGVLFGRSLILASRLQAVITDADAYTTAAINFRQTYAALPGDLPTATGNWGIAGGNNGDNYTTSCSGVQGTGTQTCNGNGDGTVSGYEVFRFWQHLANAGMLAATVTGVAGAAGSSDSVIGSNVPSGSIRGSGYSVKWLSNITGDADYFDGYYGHFLAFGGYRSNAATVAPILTPDQASSLDAKVDDGAPGTGKIRAMKSSSTLNPNCATTAVASTAAYNLTSTSALCALSFITGF